MNPQPATEAAAPAASGGDAERLSAWLDGELEPHAATPVMEQLLRQPERRRQFEDWCMVGDALRSHEVAAGHSARLCTRVCAALREEPVLLAPRAMSAHLRRNVASGVAVAAAMAVLVLVAVPLLRAPEAQSTAVAAAGGAAGADPAALASAQAPGAAASNGPGSRTVRNPRLDPYFQAHRDFTGAGVMPAAAVYLRSGNEGER